MSDVGLTAVKKAAVEDVPDPLRRVSTAVCSGIWKGFEQTREKGRNDKVLCLIGKMESVLVQRVDLAVDHVLQCPKRNSAPDVLGFEVEYKRQKTENRIRENKLITDNFRILSQEEKEEIDLKIARARLYAGSPFTCLDNKHWFAVFKALNPAYNVPGAKKLKQLMMDLADRFQ